MTDSRRLARIAGGCCALFAALPAWAGTIRVPEDASTISVAIAVASDGDEIVIGTPPMPATRWQVVPGLVVNKTLTLRGATGDPADVVIDGVNVNNVIIITGANAAGTVLQDLTITGGLVTANLPNAGGNDRGAGVRILSAGDVTIRNCVITGNTMTGVDNVGAGLYSTSTNLAVVDSIFENNIGTHQDCTGIGAYINGGACLFQGVIFRNNTLGATTPTLNAEGGGIYVDSGVFQFTDCLFESNRAGVGGGLYVKTGADTAIDACAFRGNTARIAGGLIISSVADYSTIRNSLFVANTASERGSAMRLDRAADVTNCTVHGNTTPGPYVVDTILGTQTGVSLDNCIFWSNTATSFAPGSGTNRPVIRSSIVQGGYAVANGSQFNLNTDPLFVDAAGLDFRLSPESPAIDAANSTLYIGPFSDLAGLPRATNAPTIDTGIAIVGPVIDMGAFEFQVDAAPPPACDGDANHDGSVTFGDITSVLTFFGFTCE